MALDERFVRYGSVLQVEEIDGSVCQQKGCFVGLASRPTVRILGTHGVPAAYGGFETAAENIARYLVANGWNVVVYCQTSGTGEIVEDEWQGIKRVIIPIDLPGWRGTSRFDWVSIGHACKFRDICLTFGYNTGIYNFRQRLRRIPNIINMDGIEWSRKRWGLAKQLILYVNERFAALFGNHLIADHPEIEVHLRTRASSAKISTITYGADPIAEVQSEPLTKLGLQPGKYMTLIARPLPENSIAEIVEGFSAKERGYRLVVLGKLDPENDDYHRRVMALASSEVTFTGPIYNSDIVKSLRFHGKAYLHGHTVGGTNPSLVEAMAAANPIVAHDNKYNRWVAGEGAVYFKSSEQLAERVSELVSDESLCRSLKENALNRFRDEFTWTRVASQYEDLLLKYAT
jgi:glycosyltransferase involved in cell wall biosynthesis